MRSLTIGGRTITDDGPAYVVAELGHNHGGDLTIAERMVRAAATAGASAAKLQRRHNRSLYTHAAYDAPYTSSNAFGATYGAHREALELDIADLRHLVRLGESLRIDVFATPFDILSADDCLSAGCQVFKTASGDLTNVPLLRAIAMLKRPMLISTGAATAVDVERAINAVWPINQQVALLHCTAEYPCPAEHLDLRVIGTYRERYPEVTIGLSSHYSGIEDAVIAYTLGARVFEKHFTLDRTMRGTDHAFSLEPKGLEKMVSYLDKARLMLGSSTKSIREVERTALLKMGKSLYAIRDLPRGHELQAKDLVPRSPGGGCPPWMTDWFVGRQLRTALHAEDALTELHVERPSRRKKAS